MTRQIFRRNKCGHILLLRKSSTCLLLFCTSVLLLASMFAYAHFRSTADVLELDLMAAAAGRLELTDLALFTEARYTRHPSQADLHAAFQDHPASLEHFPAGSLVGPPAALRRQHGQVD